VGSSALCQCARYCSPDLPRKPPGGPASRPGYQALSFSMRTIPCGVLSRLQMSHKQQKAIFGFTSARACRLRLGCRHRRRQLTRPRPEVSPEINMTDGRVDKVEVGPRSSEISGSGRPRISAFKSKPTHRSGIGGLQMTTSARTDPLAIPYRWSSRTAIARAKLEVAWLHS
jgi:hypothetical protein